MTGFEAKYTRDLRLPSRHIAWVVCVLYFLCTLGEVLTTRWNDPSLQTVYNGQRSNSTSTEVRFHNNIIINATLNYGGSKIAGFLNACLLFSVVSNANTSLYVASRTLYGLARENRGTNWIGNKLSDVLVCNGVPMWALLFSALSFFWLPFLQFNNGIAVDDVSCSYIQQDADVY